MTPCLLDVAPREVFARVVDDAADELAFPRAIFDISSSDSIFGLAPKTLRTTRSRRRRGIAAVSGGRSRPALARPR